MSFVSKYISAVSELIGYLENETARIKTRTVRNHIEGSLAGIRRNVNILNKLGESQAEIFLEKAYNYLYPYENFITEKKIDEAIIEFDPEKVDGLNQTEIKNLSKLFSIAKEILNGADRETKSDICEYILRLYSICVNFMASKLK